MLPKLGLLTLFFCVSQTCVVLWCSSRHGAVGQALYGDVGLLLQQELAPVHSVKTTSNWFADCGFTVLDGHTQPALT